MLFIHDLLIPDEYCKLWVYDSTLYITSSNNIILTSVSGDPIHTTTFHLTRQHSYNRPKETRKKKNVQTKIPHRPNLPGHDPNQSRNNWLVLGTSPSPPLSTVYTIPGLNNQPRLTSQTKQKSELAHPYTILSPHLNLTISSPQGGEAPLDPSSASAQILENDPVAREFLEQNRGLWTRTTPLREVVRSVTEGEFVGVLYVGGHGRASSPVLVFGLRISQSYNDCFVC